MHLDYLMPSLTPIYQTKLYIISIANNSEAKRIGLEVGDIILSVNGRQINRGDELSAAQSECTLPLTIRIERNREARDFSATSRKLGLFVEPRELYESPEKESIRLSDQKAELMPYSVILTTTDAVPGFIFEEIIGVITAEEIFQRCPAVIQAEAGKLAHETASAPLYADNGIV
jgi:membrane-associated protease RseP (regulator of RpoE activity)